MVDQHVGRRIRGKRRAMGLSEEDLAKALGITPEQLAEYETGKVRVPAEHLVRLCEHFNVTIGYFFPAGSPPAV